MVGDCWGPGGPANSESGIVNSISCTGTVGAEIAAALALAPSFTGGSAPVFEAVSHTTFRCCNSLWSRWSLITAIV